ncbi:hypothetical protein BDR07DRAFT_1382603 [Suillus spraguei]|nr:hypothetical protein BDR07DRAFT_1382603 [Suillus spraguei]
MPLGMTRSQHFFTIAMAIDPRAMQRTIHDQPYNLQWNKLRHCALHVQCKALPAFMNASTVSNACLPGTPSLDRKRSHATAALDHPSSAALSAPALKHSAAVTVKHTATATVSASATATSLNQLTLGGAAATATAPATATTLNPLLTLGGAASGWRYSNTSEVWGDIPGMTRSQHFFTITMGIDACIMQRTIHDQPYNLQWNKLQHFSWQALPPFVNASTVTDACLPGHMTWHTTMWWEMEEKVEGEFHFGFRVLLCPTAMECTAKTFVKEGKLVPVNVSLSPLILTHLIDANISTALATQIGIMVCTDDNENKFSRMQMMIYTKGTHCVIFFFDLNDLAIKAVPQSHPIFSRPTYFSVIVWTLSKLIHCDQEGLYRSEHYLAFFLQGVVVREIEKGIRLCLQQAKAPA